MVMSHTFIAIAYAFIICPNNRLLVYGNDDPRGPLITRARKAMMDPHTDMLSGINEHKDSSLTRSSQNAELPPESQAVTMVGLPSEGHDIPDSCRKNSEIPFMKRYIKAFLQKLSDSSDQMLYSVTIDLSPNHLSVLRMFAYDDSRTAADASQSLIDIIAAVEPIAQFTVPSWFDDSTLRNVIQILIITVLTVMILLACALSWRMFGTRKFFVFFFTVIFVLSVPWTWGHLYKQNLASRMRRIEKSEMIVCDPEKLSWWTFLYTNVEGDCKKLYEDMIVDPLWEVKPTQALAHTFIELFWKPMEIMGGPLGTFINDFLSPLPWFMRPICLVLALFAVFIIVFPFSGLRIRSWFLTIEPVHEPGRVFQNEIMPMVEQLNRLVELQQTSAQQIREVAERQERLYSPEIPHASPIEAIASGSPQSSSNAFNLSRIDHLALVSRHIQQSMKFYTGLGVQLSVLKGDKMALHCGNKNIAQHESDCSLTRTHFELCLVCDCSVATTVEKLKELHIPIDYGPISETGAHGKITFIYIKDPDDNLVVLAHYPHQQVETLGR